MIKVEPRGQELVRRYKKNYAIPGDAPITEEMILTHWELEKRLTAELLTSNPENRWEIFDRCYTELYSKLGWINQFVQADGGIRSDVRHHNWRSLIGEPPQRIYEVGSGKAELITYLADSGFTCKATEITRERGRNLSAESPNLSWGVSDGIHLDHFESPHSFDVVISDQVIEHLHPDDVLYHFKSARNILAEGGRYIFSTPHRCAGPSDVSAVFRHNEPAGMHLHEYTYGELIKICARAGFSRVSAVLAFPARLSKLSGQRFKPSCSYFYLRYACALENLLLLLPQSSFRRKMAKLMKLALFMPNIFMITRK